MAERSRALQDSILYNDLVTILGEANVSRDEVICQAYIGDVSFLGMVMPKHEMEAEKPDFIVWSKNYRAGFPSAEGGQHS